MALKYRPIISKLNPMGTTTMCQNQIHLFWISRFSTLKVFDWKPKSKPKSKTMHQRAMSLYWICQWICFCVIFLIFSFLGYITHHVEKKKTPLFVQIRHPLYPRIICGRFDAIGPVVLQKKLLDIDSNVFSISFPFIWKTNWYPLSKNEMKLIKID